MTKVTGQSGRRLTNLRDALGITEILHGITNIQQRLAVITHDEETLMATIDQLTEDVTAALQDIATAIQELKDIPDLSPAAQTKVDALDGQVQQALADFSATQPPAGGTTT